MSGEHVSYIHTIHYTAGLGLGVIGLGLGTFDHGCLQNVLQWGGEAVWAETVDTKGVEFAPKAWNQEAVCADWVEPGRGLPSAVGWVNFEF